MQMIRKGFEMEQITIRIKDRKKAQTLIEFLKSLDFVETISEKELPDELGTVNQENEFFALAGLWEGRDISLKTIREQAWPYRSWSSVTQIYWLNSTKAIPPLSLIYGARDKLELAKMQKHLALVKQISLDEEISNHFLALLEEYALSHKLSVPDALIAATSLSYNLPLYTLNIKDFRFIPDLKIYSP